MYRMPFEFHVLVNSIIRFVFVHPLALGVISTKVIHYSSVNTIPSYIHLTAEHSIPATNQTDLSCSETTPTMFHYRFLLNYTAGVNNSRIYYM